MNKTLNIIVVFTILLIILFSVVHKNQKSQPLSYSEEIIRNGDHYNVKIINQGFLFNEDNDI